LQLGLQIEIWNVVRDRKTDSERKISKEKERMEIERKKETRGGGK
jgi:hypothetical protein